MKKILFVFTVFLVLFSISSVWATLVKPVNIEVLTKNAEYIVTAKIIKKTNELDTFESHKMVVYYTLKVSDWIKGEPINNDNELVIKQLADGSYKSQGRIIKQKLFFPTYQIGKTYLFFLSEPHHETGLTAPIGLWQGVFEVSYDSKGNMFLPQLNSPMRSRLLKTNLDTSLNNKFLSLQVSHSKTRDSTYKSFRFMVKSILGNN